ncbi:hypothetical protein RO1_20220 [Roseburia intestinalis XB6B4]|uniref:Uncharacterized protein n=1 Tax=Roseburia intestinalis XB6B4 TaxID=718255 RepID=D4KYX1_9FIRM|nr:hypothetical protein RO1_20220 [Roseburia intestinalis XB6B4]
MQQQWENHCDPADYPSAK